MSNLSYQDALTLLATYNNQLYTITENDARQLLSYTYVGSNIPIYSSGILILNEIISLLKSTSLKEVYTFLSQIHNPNEMILNQLINEAKEEERKIEISRFQQEISKIFGKCSKCGSGALKSLQIQMRAGDEGATTFILCSNCNNVTRL